MLVLSLIPFRQFKEQLRQQRHSEQICSSSASSSSYQRAHHQQLIHQQQHQQEQQQEYGANVSMSSEFEHRASITSHATAKATKTTSSSDLRAQQQQQAGITSKSSSAQQFDVKTMQKEAVLSYVKVQRARSTFTSRGSFFIFIFFPLRHLQSRQAGGAPTSTTSSPSRQVSGGGGGGGGTAAPKSRIIPTHVVSSNSSGIRSAASTSSIPTPYAHAHGQSAPYAARRDAEKSASAEAHLGQLRTVSPSLDRVSSAQMNRQNQKDGHSTTIE